VSAKLGNGMEILSEKINEIFELGGNTDSSMLFANERQRTLCEKAKEFLEQALNASYCGETLDAVTVCVEKAADLLLALSGEKATEEVVNDVFSRFCVGK
ncbi:MAG: tRNA uridine-5-carboxymethylaminomethyl(34) synthesis GTPase MnmE, partial [Oscillospiraceae bacterium]|nr:tRNA uridine-5-carboxymethylaminomethyl(34) synthesis GTPase MnmE [Oscillospiraceae bacterium]